MTTIMPLNIMAGAARFDCSEPGWTLLEPAGAGSSQRRFIGRITFDRPFGAAPVVQIGITGFDMDNADNSRLGVSILGVDGNGFEVALKTWWNSRLWSVELNWIAIGH